MRYKVGRCRLRELRNRRGWTQDELSRRSGVYSKLISAYETNDRVMMLGNAKSLANALECFIDDLYDWETRS
jgi:transcriptional regulator with XRE-family HTH domain